MLTTFFNKSLQTSDVFSHLNENSKQQIYCSLKELETKFWQYYDYMAETIKLKKNDHLIEQGHVPGYLYFLTDGGFAKRYLHQNGKVQSLGRFEPFEFACPLYSFTAQKPSLYSIKMDSDATVMRISYKNYMFLKSLSPIIDHLEDMITKCSFNFRFGSSK